MVGRRSGPLIAVAVVELALGGACAAGDSHPSLKIVQRSPLVVSGAGFRRSELVSVQVPGTSVRVRASHTGSFRVTFSSGDRCTGGRVVATGKFGDHAVLRLPPTLCAPAGGVGSAP